jgi:hypothetical protein
MRPSPASISYLSSVDHVVLEALHWLRIQILGTLDNNLVEDVGIVPAGSIKVYHWGSRTEDSRVSGQPKLLVLALLTEIHCLYIVDSVPGYSPGSFNGQGLI